MCVEPLKLFELAQTRTLSSPVSGPLLAAPASTLGPLSLQKWWRPLHLLLSAQWAGAAGQLVCTGKTLLSGHAPPGTHRNIEAVLCNAGFSEQRKLVA